ncbi:MAG: MocR-like pyridoxine biosynthesis transcription factor PdxR [Solirubrobacteraceae bacterium]
MDVQSEPVSAGPDLLVLLARGSGATLHEQLELGLRESVRSGRLAPGARLPSSRALAEELGVSRGVVLEAYAQLTAEGYLTSSQGAPTRVASTTSIERPPVPAGSLAQAYELYFTPPMPDLAAFPRDAWMRSQRAAMHAASFRSLGLSDPRGAPELRNQLMDYLSRARAAAPEPEHTLICAGFTEGFAVLCRSLRDRGVERIALEDPGWPQHRLIAERAGLTPFPVAVDELGIDVAALAATDCEVVVVTPAHQFPTGAVLASERRGELLEWAEETDGLIVEDDYDSELRYDRVAVGALQGLAPERVCHIGSAGKRLAPGVGLGWMLSPSWLTGALTLEKGLADGGSPAVDQLALADFIARGELERHLRRMRLRYRERRDALVEALSRSLPEARVRGVAAGLFVLALLPDAVDEEALVSAAAARGVGVEGLAWHRLRAGGPPGLVLGFANLSQAAIERGVAELRRALEVAV